MYEVLCETVPRMLCDLYDFHCMCTGPTICGCFSGISVKEDTVCRECCCRNVLKNNHNSAHSFVPLWIRSQWWRWAGPVYQLKTSSSPHNATSKMYTKTKKIKATCFRPLFVTREERGDEMSGCWIPMLYHVIRRPQHHECAKKAGLATAPSKLLCT